MMIQTKNINGFRFYNIQGKFYPSVTSVLSIIPNQALERWKASLTSAQVQAVQDYTSERGEMIHYGALQTYETDMITQEPFDKKSLNYYHQYPKMKDEILIASQLFRDFTKKHQLIPESLEKCVYSLDYGYAGRVDFVGYLNEPITGEKIRIVMDIKTSKKVYEDSVSKQLSAYNKAINNWGDKLYVLLLHPGKTTLKGVEIGADKAHWKFQEIEPNFHGFLDNLVSFKGVEEEIIAGGE